MELAGLRKEDAELALAVGVERQEGEGSAWWPYLRLLSCKHTFPLFYEDTDLEDLENIPLKESLSVTRRAVELLAEKSGLEATELKEALQLVLGRRFSCEVSTGMIPLGDLLNHRFYPSCEWESPSTASPESWKLRAKMDIAPGETLNFAYCEDPNHLLMTTSGFVVEENPYDRIMARPKDLREALASVCNAQSNEDFAQWRKQQFKEQLPDPEEEGVGLSMYLVGRQPGGIQWNDSWLNLVGLAVTEDPQGQHWSATPEGLQMYLDALEKASWSLFPRGRLEEDLAKGDDFKSDNQEMAATMRRGYKQMLKEAVEKLKDRLLAGDVWQQLEKELQAPLPAAIAPPAQVQDKEVEAEDSDDDWGIKWKGPTNQGPERQQESVLDEIARMAATSSNWHKEDWTKKEERQEARDEEEDEFYEEGDRWRETFQTTEDKKADDEDWKPDDSWCEWISNSKEALAVENVVRKIRARAGPKSARSNIEIFPNDSMLQAMKTWLKRTIPEQRMLLAMLLFLEAQALDKEMVESPPQQVKLSEYDADQKAWGFACCRALDPHAPPCAETDRDAVDASREPTVAEELVAASTGLVWRPREEFETPESFIAHASKCLASQWLKWLQDGTLRSSADASSVDAELRKVLLSEEAAKEAIQQVKNFGHRLVDARLMIS
ncbi:unnamed protein product [Durusdinium trenchii]|uniref:SET domain-containing protein n=1 Tax=Durusdinium trenchii TaxID=1381693 RepID=A0ABP0IYT6_9DINO